MQISIMFDNLRLIKLLSYNKRLNFNLFNDQI